MKADLDQKQAFPERRRHPRLPALERALAAVAGDDFGILYPLIDISEGGMAFCRLEQGSMDLTGNRMDLYLEKDLHVGRLPVRVAADLPLPEHDGMPKRRCSVEFASLTPAQKHQLRAFLKLHT